MQFATDVAEKATRSAERQFATAKERAADTIERFGRAANGAERFSDYLKKTSFREVVGDLEKSARREPLLFVGSALVVGLLGGRFLKSSPRDRTAASHDSMAGGAEAAR